MQGAHYFGAPLYRVRRPAGGGARRPGGALAGDLPTSCRTACPRRPALRDLGAHRLRDLARPERVSQLLHPDLPADFPPLCTLDALPHNLPLQLTSFVGRERELGAVTALLGRAPRLVTLTGPGGHGQDPAGPSRSRPSGCPTYPDGVWLVELAALTDPALVPQAVAGPSACGRQPGRPCRRTLADALKPKRLLLLLDNCEHLLDACARLADALLRGLPRGHDPGHGPGGDGPRRGDRLARCPRWASPTPPAPAGRAAADSIRGGAAVRRPGRRRCCPTSAVTDQSAPAVAQVCCPPGRVPPGPRAGGRAGAGAAARRSSLARLEDRFRLLTGGSRTALERHQTLQAAVDWSYALLAEQEQTVFSPARRTSPAAGRWRPPSRSAPTRRSTRPRCSTCSTRPVDQSLVVVDEQPDGTARYRLLETLRQYAAERLREGRAAARLHARHAVYFAGEWGARAPAGAPPGPPERPGSRAPPRGAPGTSRPTASTRTCAPPCAGSRTPAGSNRASG